MPGVGFQFEGWYNTETGTKIETDGWIAGPNASGYYQLKPLDFSGDINGDGEITYYALFEPVTTAMTITKTVRSGLPDGMENDDTFLFLIQGHGKHTYLKLTVAITVTDGIGSAVIQELPIDEYTVTELTDWSWEYTVEGNPSQSITLSETATNNVVSFVNEYADPYWLGGESAVANNDFT